MKSVKTHQRLKKYESYTHLNIAGVLLILAIIMMIGVSSFPKNLILSLGLLGLAIGSYKILKTSKPVIISDKSICLGKMVNGFKKTIIKVEDIIKVELVFESLKEFRPAAKYTGGNVEVNSNYYRFILNDKSVIRFDNLYDEQLQSDLKDWCHNYTIDLDLEVKISIDKT